MRSYLTNYKFVIYSIICLKNNKVYIGKASLPQKRFRYHIGYLNKNKHHNYRLQQDWNKYGKENFEFCIIESCNELTMAEKEQFWVNFYRSYDIKNGYNITKNVIDNVLSEESRLKISQKVSGVNNGMYNKKHTKETRLLMSKNHYLNNGGTPNNKGIKLTKEQCQRLSEQRTRPYKLISPDGKIVEIKSTQLFAETNHLQISHIYEVLSGKIFHTKGWRKVPEYCGNWDNERFKELLNNEIKLKNKNKRKVFSFYDKNKNLIIIDNLKLFCLTSDLSYNLMFAVYHHKNGMKSHKGYTSAKNCVKKLE